LYLQVINKYEKKAVPAPAVPDPVVAAPVPAPIEPVGHGQPLWTVDAIVSHRTNHRRVVVQYRVRWSDNSTTWEPAQQVAEDVPTMVHIADVIVSKIFIPMFHQCFHHSVLPNVSLFSLTRCSLFA
jgi:Chromo (CHRromatin Organisation MOdifier) domain